MNIELQSIIKAFEVSGEDITIKNIIKTAITIAHNEWEARKVGTAPTSIFIDANQA